MNQKTKGVLFWIIAGTITLINVAWTFSSFNEIYSILFNGTKYDWGAEPFPWFYKTQQTYIIYNSIWNLIFLLVLAFQIYFILKRDKVRALYAGMSFIGLFVLMSLVDSWNS